MQPPRAYDFGHARLVEVADGLRYFTGERATVLICAQSLRGCRQLCQITFNRKTGAIFAQFSYFSGKRGVVTKTSCVVGANGTSKIEFAERGFVSSTLVKYSHPPDGRAHFSQDGKVVTKVWANALPLDGPEGHLFEIHAYDLEAFAPLVAGAEKRRRTYLPFATTGSPGGVSLVAEWRRRSELSAYSARSGRQVGPIDEIPRRHDGQLHKAAMWAPPADCPLKDHLLCLSVSIIEPPPGLTEPKLLLLGGWTYPPEPLEPGNSVEFLAFSYPIPEEAAFAEQLQSIDFVPE